MARTRIVKGTYTKISAKGHNMFSEENIITSSAKSINEKGNEKGENYANPNKFENNHKAGASPPYYLFFEVVNKQKVVIYSEEGFPKDYRRNPFKGGKLFYLPEIIYVRFSMSNNLTGVSYYVPGNPNLNNIYPYNEGMFQSINLFDWREHEEQLKIILHEVYNIYYPNSPFNCSVVMHKDSPANETTKAYTIANEKDNLFSNDTIDPIIVFLLADNGKLLQVGQIGYLYDILSTVDHEYKHYNYYKSLIPYLIGGMEAKDALKMRPYDENERKTIDEQRKSKYYEKTTIQFKEAMDDYYANPSRHKH